MNANQQELVQPRRTDAGDTHYRRLHALGRVALRTDACLHVHKAYVACNACEQSCPHDSLVVGHDALELDPTHCTACGLCAVSCPTGALAVEGAGLAPAAAGTPILIACEKAGNPTAASRTANRRVPCLGGITVNDYLRLSVTNGGATISVLDDGACEHCSTARGRGNPGMPALNAARRTLAAAGTPDKGLPQHLPISALPNGNSARATAPASAAAGRRAFFSGLSRALADSLTPPMAMPAPLKSLPSRPRTAIPSTRAEETYLLLRAIAHRHGHVAPREALLTRLEASDACRAHGVCARACPTGALQLERGDGHATLRFTPWHCIACGACERICPEHALRQADPAWGEFIDGTVTLARVATAECPRCGTTLATHDDAELCDRCRKSDRLARAGFALFHPRNRESPAIPDPP